MALFLEKVFLPLIVALIVAVFGGKVPGVSDWTQRILLTLTLFFATWFITYSWAKWFPKTESSQLPANLDRPHEKSPAPVNPTTVSVGAGSGSTYTADRQTVINQAPGSVVNLNSGADLSERSLEKIRELMGDLQQGENLEINKLLGDYPYGYAIFGISSQGEVFPGKINGFRVDWSTAKIISMDEDKIHFRAPTMIFHNIAYHNNNAIIPRRMPSKMSLGGTQFGSVLLEVRELRTRGMVVVLGATRRGAPANAGAAAVAEQQSTPKAGGSETTDKTDRGASKISDEAVDELK